MDATNLGHKRIESHHDPACEYAADPPFGNGILAEFIAVNKPGLNGTAEHALKFEDRFGIILTSRTPRRSPFASEITLSFKKPSSPSELDDCGMDGGARDMRLNNASPIIPASESIEVYRQTVTGKEMVEAIAAAIQSAGNFCNGFSGNVSSVKSEQFILGQTDFCHD